MVAFEERSWAYESYRASGATKQVLAPKAVRADVVRQALFKEMVQDLRPFSFCQSGGRAVSLQALSPTVVPNVPSDQWLKAELQREYERLRDRLREAFKDSLFIDYFSVMMDGWTLSTKGRLMYACRVRFLTDSMSIVEVPVEVSTIDGKDARIVAIWLQSALQRIGLDLRKCLVITADGAERVCRCGC